MAGGDLGGRLAAMFNKDVVVVLSEPNESFDAGALLDAHLDFIVALEKQGLLFLSGPIVKGEGALPGQGMTVLNVDSIEKARAIWADEPFDKAGQRTARFIVWRLMEGRLEVTVDLSDRRATLLGGGHADA